MRRIPGIWRRACPDGGAAAPVQITIQLKAPKDVDAVYAQAVTAGGTGVSEPADMFWNARFAQLRDPFGHLWMLNAQLPPK